MACTVTSGMASTADRQHECMPARVDSFQHLTDSWLHMAMQAIPMSAAATLTPVHPMPDSISKLAGDPWLRPGLCKAEHPVRMTAAQVGHAAWT